MYITMALISLCKCSVTRNTQPFPNNENKHGRYRHRCVSNRRTDRHPSSVNVNTQTHTLLTNRRNLSTSTDRHTRARVVIEASQRTYTLWENRHNLSTSRHRATHTCVVREASQASKFSLCNIARPSQQ